MGNSQNKELFGSPIKPSMRTKKQFKKLISDKVEAIGLINSNGNYECFNKELYKLFGFESEEMANITLTSILTFSSEKQPDNQETSVSALKLRTGQALSNGEHNFRWKYETFEGKELDVYIWLNPIRLGSKIFFQAIIRPKKLRHSTFSFEDESLTSTEVSGRDIGDFCLEEAVRITNSMIGFLGFINKDPDIISIFGFSTNAMKQCQTQSKPLIFKVSQAGLWAEAIREKKIQITNDYRAQNPKKKDSNNKKLIFVVGVANKNSDYSEEDAAKIQDLMLKMWAIFKKKFGI
ncbi:hypothetical protein M0811_13383 [Anaeramoeba ignava]|uniref:PAS domain-containing protein n=1 Tax=Anaeramoeba ignava TaxID=1746090 RepID=A0A9Q0R4Z5_ANAIG|nr:hypothetical protein M0811_13383 [Anaeramoeba ignava]